MGLAVRSQRSLRAPNPRDFSSPDRDEFLSLDPNGDRKRTMGLVAGALVAGIGLGWLAFIWSVPQIAALDPSLRKKQLPSIPETKAAGKTEGFRKSTSTSGLQAPQGGSAVSAAGASIAAKPLARHRPEGLTCLPTRRVQPRRLSGKHQRTRRFVAVREPMVAAPETRPTTIEGWTVLDVRGGRLFSKGPMGSGWQHAAKQCPGSGESIPSCVGATAG